MSLKIKNQLGIFDLQNDFSIEIEDTSPIYNERGSQSVSSTVVVCDGMDTQMGKMERASSTIVSFIIELSRLMTPVVPPSGRITGAERERSETAFHSE